MKQPKLSTTVICDDNRVGAKDVIGGFDVLKDGKSDGELGGMKQSRLLNVVICDDNRVGAKDVTDGFDVVKDGKSDVKLDGMKQSRLLNVVNCNDNEDGAGDGAKHVAYVNNKVKVSKSDGCLDGLKLPRISTIRHEDAILDAAIAKNYNKLINLLRDDNIVRTSLPCFGNGIVGDDESGGINNAIKNPTQLNKQQEKNGYDTSLHISQEYIVLNEYAM